MEAPVRVALVALNAAGTSGVPRYSVALIRALDAIASTLSDVELEVVTTPAGADALGLGALPVRTVWPRGPSVPGPLRLVVEQAVAPRLRGDLLHYFDLGGPALAPNRRFSFTFHDASFVRPEVGHAGRLQRARKTWQARWSFARAVAVVAVSQFSKDEAVARLGGDPARITVIHPGPGMTPLGGGERTASGARPYLLFVGNLTASKNVPFLVRAFHEASVEIDLVLAGHPLDDVDAIDAAVRAGPGRERIRVVTSPSDAELDRLYRGATALVFASRHEGFGFPPLEAMQRGCPVVAGDIPSVREVSGEGAMLVPLELGAWVSAIRSIATYSGLREELRRRGRTAVSQYSWERSARELVDLFVELGRR